MGCFSFASWLTIILPIILFLLFPTFLRFLTFSYTSYSSPSNLVVSDFDKKPILYKPKSSDASRVLAISVNNSSSLVRKEVKSSLGPIEEGLLRARAAIRRAAATGKVWKNGSSSFLHEMPLPRIYRNPTAFYRSYIEMERRLKVYVYEEGDAPLVHDGPCKNIYSIEGRFIQELEMMTGRFRTKDPTKAHIFFLPFSVAWMVKYVYNATTHDHVGIKRFVADYIDVIASNHPFWNRTAGADHFMLSCHDWGPIASSANPNLFENSIRALCNANMSEGFKPHKDVSIPEIHLLTGDYPAELLHPLPSPYRPYLAFFAGGPHGPIRPILQETWGMHHPDPLIQVHEYLPKGVDYFKEYILKSRFCLCPSGYEVASPRVVEAILAECVPVLISEGYYVPFSDVLKWEEFSVKVEVKDIPRLKEILESVTEEEVERMREGLRAVKKHFMLNRTAKRFDVFHMILHSVWLRRLNMKLTRSL